MTPLKQNYRALATGACAALLLSPLVQTATAQDARSLEKAKAELDARLSEWGGPVRIRSGGLLGSFGGTNGALIGVTTSSASKPADTLGVTVVDVTPGGPAEKAGIKPGDRITAVNGVSLRVAAADIEDPELRDLGQRRLIREIGKAKVGDEVELRVLSGSNTQTFKLKTVSAADLAQKRTVVTSPGGFVRTGGLEKRASIGATIGSTGSVRDTLGIFVSAVSNDGPAEKAGIIEGDRIAAINGVDVRVAREDAEDPQVASARVNRFTRELAKVAPGDKVKLRVFSAGKYREVPVTAGNAADMITRSFQFNSGDGIRMLSVPGMELQALPGIIRSRIGGDSSRIVYRKASPSVAPNGDRKITIKSSGAVLR